MINFVEMGATPSPRMIEAMKFTRIAMAALCAALLVAVGCEKDPAEGTGIHTKPVEGGGDEGGAEQGGAEGGAEGGEEAVEE